MQVAIEKLITIASQWFTAEIFALGETSISISSIAKLILSLLIVVVLSRSIKKFLKRRLLVKLRIDESNRQAIATIVSYGFGTLGFLIILQVNGFNIASLAVLAGGLGVGIGLGLQDITKNFISGLTLLIERSLKVEDFIEFEGLSGYIKEISLRSTRIRTRRGGDVIVPNTQLVENMILNWSYDTYTSRIDIPVGVAYESDPVLVTETLLKSAYMEPEIVHEPPPEVIFIGFGDSSLDFELWVWVKRIDREPQIKGSLNFLIEHNLREQGITIPFPQRDLWLRNPEVLTPIIAAEKINKLTSQSPEHQLPAKSPKPLALRYLLPQVTYFENFTDLELRRLISAGSRKRLRASDILFREGDPGDAFYIVLSGSVEVFVEKINKHLTTLEAGKFFGELSLMLGIPRTASVRALEDTILFAINHKGFEKLLHEYPDICEVIAQELGKHKEELSERQQQLRELGLVDADEDDKNPVIWVRKRLKNLFGVTFDVDKKSGWT